MSKPIAIRFCGLNPGQTPYVEIDYEDGRDTVQRLLDGSPETEALLAEAFGGAEQIVTGENRNS